MTVVKLPCFENTLLSAVNGAAYYMTVVSYKCNLWAYGHGKKLACFENTSQSAVDCLPYFITAVSYMCHL
jgi:hypothetical protein